MAEMLVDSTKLDACLDAEADAIRAKTGGSADIPFDFANNKGFADVIAVIPSGGGGQIELLASGSYTQAAQASAMTIPISFSGTATQLLVVESETEYHGQNRSTAWCGIPVRQSEVISAGFARPCVVRRTYGATETNYFDGLPIAYTFSDSSIYVGQQSGTYPIRPGTYTWYLWGIAG